MGLQEWFAQKSKRWAALRQKPAMRLLIWSTWIPVGICFLDHAYFLGHISGNSMTPALNPDSNLGRRDIVLLQKFLIKQPGYLKVGDVVLLRNPMDPDKFLCKRILGVGGDEIVTRHPYPQKTAFVPFNHVWVEGDNIHSFDSNNFGPVSLGLMHGKCPKVLWPFRRFGDVPSGGREARKEKLGYVDDEVLE